jgi:putative restriction endonuclease
MANWTREESILALELYCRIPFGSIHKANPQVIALANLIGRSPSAVGMKMGNFGRSDPELKKRGVNGLSNGSKLDEVIWQEFFDDIEILVEQAVEIAAKYKRQALIMDSDLLDINSIPDGAERERLIKQRIHQQFFRDALLSSYHSKCCVTGINIPELLIASHIKPWNVSDPRKERTSPTNGLLLNAFHDKAFDKGFISINSRFEIMISPLLSEYEANQSTKDWLISLAGRTISLPEMFLPASTFIEYHNDVVYRR